ncbi:MAG: hypothetical protein CEE38_03105 [Planctomycetes bacterium B3_Pla]|nr:MAG: hypothetical protein CEE38_03105 [Planctomycetes bacterium B3_Pla]
MHALTNHRDHSFLTNGPVERPDNWLSIVNQRRPEDELEVIRNCVKRGSPLGNDLWARKTAKRLGLQSTLNPRGRPPKKAEK